MNKTDQFFMFDLQPFACIPYSYYYYLLGIYKHRGSTFEQLLAKQPAEIGRDFSWYCTAFLPKVPHLTPYELLCIRTNHAVRRNVVTCAQLLLRVMGCALSDTGRSLQVTDPRVKDRYLDRHADALSDFVDRLRALGFAELEKTIRIGIQ